MPRKPRYVPPGGSLVEITTRTVHGRALLRPGPEVNDLILGVLGRAQRMYSMRVCAFVFMSTHYHLLLDVDDALQLARFMAYLNGNVAKEVGRAVDWKEKFWARRYHMAIVSNEQEAQVARLRYLVLHGLKEGLVDSPEEWPGVHSATAFIKGDQLSGHWFDRSREFAARRRGVEPEPRQFATLERVHLSLLPCFEVLTAQQTREIVRAIIEEARVDASWTSPGAAAVQAGHPHRRLGRLKKTPGPLFHAFRSVARTQLAEALGAFVAAYRIAAQRLRAGGPAVFPQGSFPPALEFVGPSVVK